MSFGTTKQELVRTVERSTDADRNERQTDLAWAAGFFDGEGHIAVHRTRNTSSFNLSLHLSQVDPRPVYDLQRIVGGRIYPSKAKRVGHKPTVQWGEWGERAGEILKLLRPYLRHKHEQADIALEFQGPKRTHRGVVALPEEIARGEYAATTLRAIRASFGRD